MTERRGSTVLVVAIIAPLTAVLLGATTVWAAVTDPLVSPPTASSPVSPLDALTAQADAQSATITALQHRITRVERRAKHVRARAAHIAKSMHSIRIPPTPTPVIVTPPTTPTPPPPTHTTTGSSGH